MNFVQFLDIISNFLIRNDRYFQINNYTYYP